MGSARSTEVVIPEATGKRQYRSKQERRQIVEETLQPGASVAVIARQHGVNANQVFHWRKLYPEGRLGLEPSSKLRLSSCSLATHRKASPSHWPPGRSRRAGGFWCPAVLS